MKKHLSVIVVLFFIGSIGCTGNSSSSSSSDSTSDSTSPPTPKSWRTPELIETSEAGDADDPQIGFDAEGNAIAVWTQHDGARRNVYSNRYTKSSGWETAELIEWYNVGNANNPQIAIDTQGNAIAVWMHNDGTLLHIFSNRYTKDNGWGTMQLIEDDNGASYSPQIAVDSNGNAITVWTQLIGEYNIYANRYDAISSEWEGAELIETDNAGSASSPQVAFDIDNNAIAVWNQSNGIVNSIFSNRYINGFLWELENLIETDDAGAATGARIAFDNMGNAIAVWHQADASGDYNIWANRYVSGLDWDVAERIETNDTESGVYPEIAFDSQGNAIAVWEQDDGTRDNIWASRYVNGSGWGTAELLESDNLGDATYPQVAFDASDDGIVVWYQSDGITNSIYSRFYVKDSGWEDIELIEDSTSNAQHVKIATDGDGNAIAIWSQHDGTDYSIYAASYR